jgi:hypothetical protein
MQGGDRMTLSGLVSAAQYNGQSVTLLRANNAADRYVAPFNFEHSLCPAPEYTHCVISQRFSGASPIHAPHFMVDIRWIVRLDAAVWNLKELTVRPVNLR